MAKLTVPNTAEYTTSVAIAFPNPFWIWTDILWALYDVRTYAIGNASGYQTIGHLVLKHPRYNRNYYYTSYTSKKIMKSFSDFFSTRMLPEKNFLHSG